MGKTPRCQGVISHTLIRHLAFLALQLTCSVTLLIALKLVNEEVVDSKASPWQLYRLKGAVSQGFGQKMCSSIHLFVHKVLFGKTSMQRRPFIDPFTPEGFPIEE